MSSLTYTPTIDPEVRLCSCGRQVLHRACVPTRPDASLFVVPLWRPIRHCPQCGGNKDLKQESAPGEMEIHASPSHCLTCLRANRKGGRNAPVAT